MGDARDRRGRAVGIDLGSRRIGVAVTDSAGTVALPRSVIERTGDTERDHRRIADLVLDEEALVVVVGLPLSLDGSTGPAARAARKEAESLRLLLEGHGVEVEVFDERLTTVSAHRVLAAGGIRERERRTVVDRTAAALMLSAWLESSRRQ